MAEAVEARLCYACAGSYNLGNSPLDTDVINYRVYQLKFVKSTAILLMLTLGHSLKC